MQIKRNGKGHKNSLKRGNQRKFLILKSCQMTLNREDWVIVISLVPSVLYQRLQGSLKNYLLPKIIKKMVFQQYKIYFKGLHCVWLCHDGEFVQVVMDDYFPCSE
jgi:hypothetical protein